LVADELAAVITLMALASFTCFMRRTMPSFENTKSPAFSNLLKYKGFGRLY
jgi:hypothetical protein